jgi:hypothetical protein
MPSMIIVRQRHKHVPLSMSLSRVESVPLKSEHLANGAPRSRLECHEREIDLDTGIGKTNTAGAAWLALPSELHTSNGVWVSTRTESGLEVAGISSVWKGISSVSYHSSPDDQSCSALHLSLSFVVSPR